MNTVISTYYLNKIRKLASSFADARSQMFSKKYQKKVFNSTYQVYYNISLFLYLRLNKISPDSKKFKFNHIFCSELKQFSCKLYHKILKDLEENQIIAVNNHYFHGQPELSFSKSYLMHRRISSAIDESKQRLQYKLVEIEIPDKVMKILNVENVDNVDDLLYSRRKLNRFNRQEQTKNDSSILNYYSQLEYDEKNLDEYCKNDDFLYNHLKRRLLRLKEAPKLVKGRWYHPFHEMPKQFREKILKLEGENIKEIFDISASDLHMLAKHLENVDGIPQNELIRFQKDVKNDFRKELGIRKDGKCKANVKTAFKVYLNLSKERYENLRIGSITSKIDEMFEERYPNIREYVRRTDDIWQIAMNREFEVMSNMLVNDLAKNGIKALTCHDALYVKQSVDVPNIKEMFYQRLDLISDRTERMLEL